MSFFLYMSIPYEVENILEYFGKEISLEDITETELGDSIRGQKDTAKVYVITVNMYSQDLIDRGYWRNKKSFLFINAVKKLITKIPYVSYVIHFGHLGQDCGIEIKEKRKISITQFEDIYPLCEEDVKYYVMQGR